MNETPSNDDLMNEALRRHRQGRLDDAAALYRRVLQTDRDNAGALHLLGAARHQQGRHADAVELIQRAIAVKPNDAAFHCNLGEAFRAMRQFDQAVQCGQTAARLQPNNPNILNNLGLALQDGGKQSEAAECFRNIVRRHPAFAEAHNNLAKALRELGCIEEATRAFRRAVELQPDSVEALSNLSQILMEQEMLDEALTRARRAVELQPNFAPALNNLGNILRKLGHLDEAVSCYEKALGVNPRLAMSYSNLGQVLDELGRSAEAIACFQKAIRLEPRTARFLQFLGSAFLDQDHPFEAEKNFRRAAELDANELTPLCGIGAVYRKTGRLDEALVWGRKLIEAHPSSGKAYLELGHALSEAGKRSEAIDCYQKAREAEPDNLYVYERLADELGDNMSQEDIAALIEMSRKNLAPKSAAELHYTLAHVLDARKNYATAGDHADKANASKMEYWRRRKRAYDSTEHDELVDQIIATFDRDFFRRVHGWGADSPAPVFHVGFPRSGKTILEKISAGHSQVYGAGELSCIQRSFEYVSNPSNSEMFRDRLSTSAVAEAAIGVLSELTAHNPHAVRIVDTMPQNYLYLGWIATLFPRAHIVHCRRDLRDTALACWFKNFKHYVWACDVEFLTRRIQSYQRVMQHWRETLPVSFLEIDYEETVSDTQTVARRVIDFLGLPWESECDNPSAIGLNFETRWPLHAGYQGRWKSYQPYLPRVFKQLEVDC